MRLRSLLLGGFLAAATAVLALAQQPGVNSTLDSVFTIAYEKASTKPTYSASMAGMSAPTVPTDVCSLYGSSTKLVRVRKVIVSLVGGALQTDPISIVKRSSISSGAFTNSAIPFRAIAYDSGSAASTATLDIYTTSPPTLGTLVGVIVDVYATIAGATTAVAQPPRTVFDFGELGSSIFLRSASESISVNFQGLAGALTTSCTFEWTEE